MDDTNKSLKSVGGGEIRKKSEFAKIVEAFVPESKPNIGGSLLKDIIAPSLKKLTYEIVESALGMFLWGDSAPRSTLSSNNSRINYQQISTSGYNKPAVQNPARVDGLDYSAWFKDRGKADMALMDLQAAAERSKCITVADLYSVAGIESSNYQINKYGWASDEFLANSKVARALDGGWYIKLPKPYQI